MELPKGQAYSVKAKKEYGGLTMRDSKLWAYFVKTYNLDETADSNFLFGTVANESPVAFHITLEQKGDPDASKVIELARDGDAEFGFRGSIDYFEPKVNEATGTLRMRAVFDNADGRLVPGLFVRVRVAASELEAATVVPESALAADQAGRHLLVVGDGDVVERRAVELGALLPEGRVVLSGLAATDRVIVAGLLRARPGAKVSPRTSDDNQ